MSGFMMCTVQAVLRFPFTHQASVVPVSCSDFKPDMKGLSPMEILFPKSATEKLYELIKQGIEQFSYSYIGTEYGNHWDQLSEHEAEVFGLSLDITPDLVALYVAYEAVLGICVMYDDAPDIEDILEGVRNEHPFLKRASKTKTLSCKDFQQFGKLFGYRHRLTYVAYYKREFYDYRLGLFAFSDERPSYLEDADV